MMKVLSACAQIGIRERVTNSAKSACFGLHIASYEAKSAFLTHIPGAFCAVGHIFDACIASNAIIAEGPIGSSRRSRFEISTARSSAAFTGSCGDERAVDGGRSAADSYRNCELRSECRNAGCEASNA